MDKVGRKLAGARGSKGCDQERKLQLPAGSLWYPLGIYTRGSTA